MRILLAAQGSDAKTLAALEALLPRAEVVLVQAGDLGQPLELALRNAFPEQEVVTVPIQVVVDAEDPTKPRAILGLRSLRTLIERGSMLICTFGQRPPVAIGTSGNMEVIEAAIEAESVLELLARRLDARRLDAEETVSVLGYARLA